MGIKMDGRTRERFEIMLDGTGSKLIETDTKGRITLSPILVNEYERVAGLRARGGVGRGSPPVDVLILVILLAETRPKRSATKKAEANGKLSETQS